MTKFFFFIVISFSLYNIPPCLLADWAHPLTVTVMMLVPRIQELEAPWARRKAVTLSLLGHTPQLAKEYLDIRSTQVSVNSWWNVRRAYFRGKYFAT